MNHEKNVREAAEKFHEAITAARKAGFAVTYPHTFDGLLSLLVSETKKAVVTTQVDAGAVDPIVAEKAGVAAQKAADKVVAKA